jgi:hypothetical protein
MKCQNCSGQCIVAIGGKLLSSFQVLIPRLGDANNSATATMYSSHLTKCPADIFSLYIFSMAECSVAEMVLRWPAVRQVRGSNIGPAPHGGLCLMFTGTNEEYPQDLGEFDRINDCMNLYKYKLKRVAYSVPSNLRYTVLWPVQHTE